MEPTLDDRLAARARPAGIPVMHQAWGDLLFLHWMMAPERLRPLLPAGLELDTFDGQAWVGVTPFRMWGLRPTGLPPLPLVSRTHEINVRTYVHRDRVPGIWFFSLDADNPLAVLGARLTYRLPYFQARMSLERGIPSLRFTSRRTHGGAPPAEFTCVWKPGGGLPEPAPETLEFFLIERYCLYVAENGKLYRSRIHHRPWSLREARLLHLTSSMLEAAGLPPPADPPLLHAQGAPLDVWVWPRQRVA